MSFPASAYPDFSISLSPQSLSVCPCTTMGSFTGHGRDMELTIRNEGNIADTYELYLELPDKEWSGFIYNSKREITLGPGEERVIEPIWITPGCGVKPGKYKATIGARSKTLGDRRETILETEILKCHQVDLELKKSGDTCRGMPIAVEMNITNYGKYEERFSLSADKDWARFSADAVSVKSGGMKSLVMTLEPPMDVTGTKSIIVSLESLDSYAKDSEEFKLDIRDCYSFDARLEPASQSACKGKTSNYILRISNTGSKGDSYSIYAPDWVSPDSDSLSLGPGESRDVVLSVSPIGVGESKFNMTVISSMHPTYPELRRVIQGMADVRECRGIAIVVSPSHLQMCSREGAEYQVTVKNIGTVGDTFKLESTIGTLEHDKVVLNAGESKILKLFIDPGISPGNRTIKLGASSDGIYDEDEAELLVENCYSAEISIEPDSVSVCPCSSVRFEAELKNTGKYPDNYTFSLQVPENLGAGLEEAPELMPWQSKSLGLEISIPCGMEAGSYNLKAEAESENTKTLQNATLLVKTMEECYSLELSAEETSLRTVRGKAAVFTITARNLGLVPDSYQLSLEGPEWSYLSMETLDMGPGESRTLYLYVSPEYGSELREYGLKIMALSEHARAEISLTLDLVQNITEPLGPQPSENITPNVTANVSMNVSIGGTGQIIGEGVALSWKVIAVTIIALAIVVILITRFAVLIR